METLSIKEFKKLPKNERAVLIAKDVIQQIKLQNFNASHTYIDISIERDIVTEKNDLSKVLKEEPKAIFCEVCARGSLFLSAVKFKNKLTIEQAQDMEFDYPDFTSKDPELRKAGSATKYLSGEFSIKQQSLIEAVFEDWRNSDSGYGLTFNDIERCKKFKKKVLSNYAKLKRGKIGIDNYTIVAICRNIIKNDGLFIP